MSDYRVDVDTYNGPLDLLLYLIRRDEIDEMKTIGRSLMPEGLLKGMSDAQIRDLMAYLRSTQPLNN